MNRRRPLSASKLFVSHFFTLIFLIAATATLSAQQLSKLPYVPTPQIVVDEMLKMAGVTAKDFVIDLGSGDGRMIITAARSFKASGLGVDIDRKLVDLAANQAKAAGVADRVRFIEQDMFKANIGSATVVTLYVLPDFMEMLRPKLLSELKPGARIVAHDYYMSGWYPDRQLTLTVPEKMAANGTDKAYLYLWIVPSVVAGDWRMDFAQTGKTQLMYLSFNHNIRCFLFCREQQAVTFEDRQSDRKGDEIVFSSPLGGQLPLYRQSKGDRNGRVAVSRSQQPSALRATKLPPDKNDLT